MMFGMRRMQRVDGSYIWMHLAAYQVGELYYALWRDATQFKEAQASLKEYLLATSHDMRTPVTGIITAAQLLEARPSVQSDGEAAFLVQTIKSCGSLMLSVLSNVLEMRNMDGDEGGALDSSCALTVVLRPEPFNPRALMAELFAATCIAVGHSASNGATVDVAASMPETVLADLERMKRVWQNIFIAFLRNSTDDRQLRIDLACPVSPDDIESAELQLDLTDAERVISAQELHSQFTPYVQDGRRPVLRPGLVRGAGLCARHGRLAGRAAHAGGA
jgi:signal transduction histidine kinase